MLKYITYHRIILFGFVASSIWAGFDMVGSSNPRVLILGLILLCLGSWGAWWFLLASLTEARVKIVQEYPKPIFLGGAFLIFVTWVLVGLWIYEGSEPTPQVVSTNQSGGVTGNDNTVTNNYYAEKKPHPYSLNDEQIALLARRMAPFARSFDKTDFIFCIMGSPDSDQLATDLVKAFRTAGWIIPSRDGFSSNLFQQTPKGIFIQVPPGDKYPPGYREFILTLKEFGIVPPGKVQGASNPALPPDQFQIIVGTRP